MNLQKNSLVKRLIKIVNIAIAFAFLSYIPLQAFTDSNNLKYANNESFEKPVIQGGGGNGLTIQQKMHCGIQQNQVV